MAKTHSPARTTKPFATRGAALGACTPRSSTWTVSDGSGHRGDGRVAAAATLSPIRRGLIGQANYPRFWLAPNPAIAVAVRVKSEEERSSASGERSACSTLSLRRKRPYDWLLDDAMAGDNTLFTRELSEPPGRR